MNADDRYTDEWGRVIFRPAAIYRFLYQGQLDLCDEVLVAPEAEIEAYNKWCRHFGHPEFTLKAAMPLDEAPRDWHVKRQATWFMPEEFAMLDIEALLLAGCTSPQATARVFMELDLFRARNLLPLLRFLHYMVETLRRHRVWWGVGRGSSVASYCLFLLGVHKIDALAYQLDITEFLK